jgi:putative ABC transport system permease protein
MLRNYFVIAWRNLRKNKLHSGLNIIGLTIGISACTVIYLLVSYELSFNRQIVDQEKIYRVYSHFSGAFEGTNRGVTTGVQSMIRNEFTGLEFAVRINTYSGTVTVPGENPTKEFKSEKQIALIDPEYFSMINSYDWLVGSPDISLGKPNQVVLSKDQATKYFGNLSVEEFVGKELHYNDSLVLIVSGIVNPPAFRTDFEFTDFISHSTIENSFLKKGNFEPDNWGSTNSCNQIFIRLKNAGNLTITEQQLKAVDARYKEENKEMDWFLDYKLQPLADLHFNATLGIFDNSRATAHKSTLTTLTIITVLLLIIAAINFINMETALAVRRAKEVGVRKVLGSTRWQLIQHFLGQSLLITSIAVILSVPLAELSIIFFKEFIPVGVSLQLDKPSTILFLIGTLLVVGIMAGMYPAFVLSSFLPALALKNQAYTNSASTRSAYLRKALIVFQFGFAQVLIIGTLVILSQIDFMLTKDLGFKKDAIVNIQVPWTEKEEKRFAFKHELEQLKEVEQVSFCGGTPASSGFSSNFLTYKGGKEEITTLVFRKFGDENYIPLYGIQLLAGRNLEPSDTMREFIVNETYLKEIGLRPEEAIGEFIWENDKPYPIVGVVKDFHTLSLNAEYKPVYMACENNFFYSFAVKLPFNDQDQKQSIKSSIEKIESTWKKVYPDHPFDYQFVDETIRNFYKTEQRTSKLAGTAMTIAIIICCLGLFGLASFTAIQRTKEIGIRKVLGATVNNIVILLSSDFLKLVAIAFLFAAPVAYYMSSQFLDKYAFKIDISWQLFAGAAIVSVVLAFVTISYQSIKAALINPADSLKNE